MPLFIHPVTGSLGMHGQTVELTGEANGKIADIDHFLNFADTLCSDLIHFKGYQLPERFLIFPESVGQIPYDQSSFWCWDQHPVEKRLMSRLQNLFIRQIACLNHLGNQFTIHRIVGGKFFTIGILDPPVGSNTGTWIPLF